MRWFGHSRRSEGTNHPAREGVSRHMLYVNQRVLPTVCVRSISVVLAPWKLDRRSLVYCLPSVFTALDWRWMRFKSADDSTQVHLLAILPHQTTAPWAQIMTPSCEYESEFLPMVDFDVIGHGVVRVPPVSLMSN